jgi:hypothetical protein
MSGFGANAKINSIGEAHISDEMAKELKSKLNTTSDDLREYDVINFGYSDYGGDFFDKVAIAYFRENYPDNIIVENTAYSGEIAVVFGEPAKEYMEQTESYPFGFEDIETAFYEAEYNAKYEGIGNFITEELMPKYKINPKNELNIYDWDEVNKLLEEQFNPSVLSSGQIDYSSSDWIEHLEDLEIIQEINDEDEEPPKTVGVFDNFAKGGIMNNKIWIAFAETSDGKLLSERFTEKITHHELYNHYNEMGYEIVDSVIHQIDNSSIVEGFIKMVDEYIEREYDETIDWSRSALLYEIDGSTMVIKNCVVNTFEGNKYEITPHDVFEVNFAQGGRITTNDDIIRYFLTDIGSKKINNLRTHSRDNQQGVALVNYSTTIARRMGNKVYVTARKYSVTTSKIQSKIKYQARNLGLEVIEVDDIETLTPPAKPIPRTRTRSAKPEKEKEKTISAFDIFARGGKTKKTEKQEDSFSNVFLSHGFKLERTYAGIKFFLKKHGGKKYYGTVDLKNRTVSLEDENGDVLMGDFSVQHLINVLESINEKHRPKNLFGRGGHFNNLSTDDSDFFFGVDDVEFYKGGGEVKSKSTIVNKIGFPEETADYFIEVGGKFAVWLANATMQKALEEWSMSKDDFLKSNEAKNNYIRINYGGGIREIIDWLKHPYTPQQNLRELTFDEALEKSREWHDQLESLGGDVDYVEPKENEIWIEYPETPDGRKYYWVRIPASYCDIESKRMGHCGRTGQGNELISLRSINPFGTGHIVNESHVTIAYNPYDAKIVQAKGKKNQKPAEKYNRYIYDLVLHLAKNGLFEGFSAEYQSLDDYGFSDMSKEEIETLYQIEPDIFQNFIGQLTLFNNKIIDTKPLTVVSISFDIMDLADMVSIGRNTRKDFIEWVLGEFENENDGSYDWYYKNAKDYVDNLNKTNYAEVIDEIVEITKLPKEQIVQNGAKHYLAGEDEDFDEDLFDDIKRSIATAYTDAETSAYNQYYKKQIESALEELGNVYQLNHEGADMHIDLSKKLSDAEIQAYMDNLGDEDLEDVLRAAINDGSIQQPVLRLDERYTPYISNEDFNFHFELMNF